VRSDTMIVAMNLELGCYITSTAALCAPEAAAVFAGSV